MHHSSLTLAVGGCEWSGSHPAPQGKNHVTTTTTTTVTMEMIPTYPTKQEKGGGGGAQTNFGSPLDVWYGRNPKSVQKKHESSC